MKDQESKFEKHFLIPITITSAIVAYFFFALWQTGIGYGFSRTFSWLFYTILYSLAFFTISIITIVRLFMRRKVRHLVAVIIFELLYAPVLWSKTFQELALKLNFYIYQPQRKKVLELARAEQLISAETETRNTQCVKPGHAQELILPDVLSKTVNRQVTGLYGKPEQKSVTFERTCANDTNMLFYVDEALFGPKWAVVYSTAKPHLVKTESYRIHDSIPNVTETLYVDKYPVEEVIDKKWYYVRVPQPGMFDGVFKGIFSGMFSGLGGTVPAGGGCGCDCK